VHNTKCGVLIKVINGPGKDAFLPVRSHWQFTFLCISTVSFHIAGVWHQWQETCSTTSWYYKLSTLWQAIHCNLNYPGSMWRNKDIFDYILITNLMHWLLFIHKILFSSTCFEPQVLIFRRIQLYTYSLWHCHSLWEFVVACRYTAWGRSQAVYRQATRNSHRVTVPYAACILLYPPEDEHLRFETCRGESYFMNK